jgi:hypothetical protein
MAALSADKTYPEGAPLPPKIVGFFTIIIGN